jgi:STE24 endopeptidase
MQFRTWWLCCMAVLLLCLTSRNDLQGAPMQNGSTQGAESSTAMPTVIPIPPEAQASSHFNAQAATNAYIASMPAQAKERSDAYFEGGYWLLLWDFLVGVIVAILLLNLRWSAGMRNVAERLTRFKPVHTFVYWCEYLVITSILTLG